MNGIVKWLLEFYGHNEVIKHINSLPKAERLEQLIALTRKYASDFYAELVAETVNLISEPKRSRLLLSILNEYREENIGFTLELSRQLVCLDRNAWLTSTLNWCLASDSVNNVVYAHYAEDIAVVLNRKLTEPQFSIILRRYLEAGLISDAQRVVRELDRKLKLEEILVLIDYAFSHQLDKLSEAISLLPGRKRKIKLSLLLKKSINRGDLWRAQKVAGFLKYKLNRTDLLIILNRNIKQGDIGAAQKTTALLNRSLTNEESYIVRKNHIKQMA